MQHPDTPDAPTMVRELIDAIGTVQGVARALGVPRSTIYSVVAGTARKGTILLVERGWRELVEKAGRSVEAQT